MKKYRKVIILLCLIIGLSCNTSFADEVLHAPIPTLDKLHSENDVIPDTNPPVIYPESAYSITQGTEDDYNFTTQAYDSSGNLTTQYYKINLNLNDISPEGLTWEEVSSSGVNTVDVTLPNNETRHFHYTYKTPEDYTLDTSHIGLIIKREDDIYNMNYIRNNAYFRNNLNLEHVKGNFIGNYGYGGLDNYGTIDYLISNFISNNSEEGGGIDNSGTIRQIFGDFIGNYTAADSYGRGCNGGGIYNDNGFIGHIVGDFIANHSSSSGGGIYNQSGTIENIDGNFIGNYSYDYGLQGDNGLANGGAISNGSGTIEQINAFFIGNYSESDASTNISYSRGGAILNGGQISIINSSFYNNYAKAKTEAKGGAIYTAKDMNVSADNGVSIFQGNYTDTNGVIDDNAIFVDNTKLTLEAKNNGQIYLYDNIRGTTNANITLTGDATGTINIFNDIHDANVSVDTVNVNMANDNIHNYNFNNLKSDTNANYTIDVNLAGNGSSDTITSNVTTDDNNSMSVVTLNGLNLINKTEENIKDNYIIQILNTSNNNLQLALGEKLKGDNIILANIEGKTVSDEITNAVNWNDKFETYKENISIVGDVVLATTNTLNDSIGINLTGKEITKTDRVSLGDTLALVNQLETTEDRNFNFDTSSDVYEVSSDLGTTSEGTLNINGVLAPVPEGNSGRSTINGNNHSLFKLDNETTLNVNNVRITGANNVVTGNNKDAVININNSEITNNAEGITTAGSVNISGNSTIENNGSGITVTSDSSVITLDAADAEITLRDRLTGVTGARLNINRGTTNFEKKVSALDIMMERANVNVSSDDLFDGNNMTVNSASNLNMANNTVGTMHLNNFTLNDNLNMSVDVDLANKSMDRLTADSYNLGDNNVNVSNMNLLTSTDRYKTDILFADEGLKNNVTTSISEVAYSPIYKYNVAYEKDTGNFTFTRPGVVPPTPDNPNPVPDNSYNSYNPAVMASPVASQLGGYMAMLDTYNNAFMHMDMYMLKPSTIRLAEQKENRYAITDTTGLSYKSNEMNSKGIWVKPFAAYDSVGLKNGPKVNNFSYGTFIGGDTEMFKTKGGFYGVVSPYIAYQGSHQSYSGNSIYQNGGTLGGTATFYKGNFFTGLTAGVGMNVADASTMYGSENFPMLMAGVANKTGYNFEFKDGRFIIQPNLMLSYTFVNAFDYTNGAGVKINSDPLHALQITPNVKFIMNTKNGWQPYAAFGMHWNIMDETNVTANTAYLPELSVKPYFSYGLGIQRVFGDRFTAYGQIMLRNGGRNGIAATFGGRYMFGHETKTDEEAEEI